jgi:hypothetical protein
MRVRWNKLSEYSFCAHWKEREPVFYAAMKRKILCPAGNRTTLTHKKWQNLVINCPEIVFPGSTIFRNHNYYIQTHVRFSSRGFLLKDFGSVVINLRMLASWSFHILRFHPLQQFYNKQ